MLSLISLLLLFLLLSYPLLFLDCNSGDITLSLTQLQHPSIFIELWSTGHNNFFGL